MFFVRVGKNFEVVEELADGRATICRVVRDELGFGDRVERKGVDDLARSIGGKKADRT